MLRLFVPDHDPTRLHHEAGVSMVFFALLLMVLLGFAALAIDGGYIYLQQQRMQVAADAAAFAGGRLVTLGRDEKAVDTEIRELARLNGATRVEWRYINNGRGVEVTAHATYDSFFARILGINTFSVSAPAAVGTVPISEADKLLPMTVSCDVEFTYGDLYTIWDKAGGSKSGGGGGKTAPGAFGWLDWNGGSRGNPELVDNLLYPVNSGFWGVGDLIPSGPGVQNSSSVKNALDRLIGQSVTIPLYDRVSGSGANTTYRICGFGQFTLVAYNFQGNDKWISGRFVRTLRSGGATPGSGTTPDRGVYVLTLTR